MNRRVTHAGPFLPSDEATAVAREHVLWLQQNARDIGPGTLLASMDILWPHDHDPSWTDAMLIMAAWWDRGRGDHPYSHDRKVIPLPARRAA